MAACSAKAIPSARRVRSLAGRNRAPSVPCRGGGAERAIRHSGACLTGLIQCYELVVQLRRRAGARQVHQPPPPLLREPTLALHELCGRAHGGERTAHGVLRLGSCGLARPKAGPCACAGAGGGGRLAAQLWDREHVCGHGVSRAVSPEPIQVVEANGRRRTRQSTNAHTEELGDPRTISDVTSPVPGPLDNLQDFKPGFGGPIRVSRWGSPSEGAWLQRS